MKLNKFKGTEHLYTKISILDYSDHTSWAIIVPASYLRKNVFG